MVVVAYKSGLEVTEGCFLMYKGGLRHKVGKPAKLIQSVMCSNYNCLKVSRLKTFTLS